MVSLLIYTFSLPFVVVSHLDSVWIAVVVNFLAVSTYWTIDEVCVWCVCVLMRCIKVCTCSDEGCVCVRERVRVGACGFDVMGCVVP